METDKQKKSQQTNQQTDWRSDRMIEEIVQYNATLISNILCNSQNKAILMSLLLKENKDISWLTDWLCERLTEKLSEERTIKA